MFSDFYLYEKIVCSASVGHCHYSLLLFVKFCKIFANLSLICNCAIIYKQSVKAVMALG